MSIINRDTRTAPPLRRLVALVALSLVVLAGAACSSDSGTTSTGSGGTTAGGSAPASGDPVTLRLGYFPNVTHAPAVLGVQDGVFAKNLSSNVTLETSTFNAGTEAIEALFSDAIDATFIGPNPAINGFAESQGEALRIVAGTTSGGASLVVKPGITGPQDLKGKSLATPSLGNTQDVALRAWLKDNGLNADTSGGGDVSIKPQSNGDTLNAFKQGEIDGAWVPEPWATRLVLEGGGERLIDERELWPDGEFVTTHLIVSTTFLDEHPDVVKQLLTGLIESVELANGDSAAAQKTVNDGIEAATTTRLPEETITESWKELTFTVDPIASSLEQSKNDAVEVGLLEPVDLQGIYDLSILNELLKAQGKAEVAGQ